MTLPNQALFTIPETMRHLALSRPSIYRLIEEGQLTRVHPRPRSARITRESLAAHLVRAAQPGEVAAHSRASLEGKVRAQQGAAQDEQRRKKVGLLERWGLKSN